MKRLPDWQLRLEALVQERQAQPFAWGHNDCAGWAADAVHAITGQAVLSHLRGLPVRAGLRAVREFDGLQNLATVALGWPCGPSYAQVGDVVLVRIGRRQALGVCNGATALGPGRSGLVAVEMRDAQLCWRVG